MKRKNNFLLHGTRQLNLGAIFSGVGFLLYALAMALEQMVFADACILIFDVVSVYVFVSVAVERRRDKNAVSYSLLWGQAALTLLICMCAILTLRDKLGL